MVLLQCKCGYIWDYRGSSNYATCPVCHRKVNISKHKIDFNEQETDKWLIEQLKKAEQKLPEEDYKPKIQWAIETLSNPAPAMQKIAARMFTLSIIKNL